MSSQRGGEEAGTEGHEELQPPGVRDEHRGHEPGVLAPGAGRGEGPGEAETLCGAGDLGEVADRGGPDRTGRAGGDAVAAADEVAAVAVGGQEPVGGEGHESLPIYRWSQPDVSSTNPSE